LPIGHGRAGPDDSKLRDDPDVLLGSAATAAFRRVDGTCTPDILVIAVALVILILAAATNDDRESCLPEPSVAECQIDQVRSSQHRIDDRDAASRELQRLPDFNVPYWGYSTRE
jgi:hypothetical protein